MDRQIRVSDWFKFHPWPSASGLRGLIARSDSNGFKKVYKKVGGTILIDEGAFFRWVDERNTNK